MKITPQFLAEAKLLLRAAWWLFHRDGIWSGRERLRRRARNVFDHGRPNDNPLIAHVHKDYDLQDYRPRSARRSCATPSFLTWCIHPRGK
ncbi:MAG: hypothetical protein ACLRSW_17635 [Christensenellaceae bacterium]